MSQLRVGISGWTYPAWRGVFYPAGLPQKQELEYTSQTFNSLEINGSFYSLQRPSSYQRWYDQSPPGFIFAVKGSRFITHMKKLNEVRVPLANFFASGLLRLGKKLGPILWQFSPQLSFDEARFGSFLDLLPRTTEEAAALAEHHDHRLAEQSWTASLHSSPLRYAFEVRHPSFFVPAFAELLARHNAALVLADTAGNWPYAEEITADFVYIRLHGAESLYASGYTDEQLDWWAERVRAWQLGGEPPDARRLTEVPPDPVERDVYTFFDNDAKVHAPFDAQRLAARLQRA